jgi:hypothetical protein
MRHDRARSCALINVMRSAPCRLLSPPHAGQLSTENFTTVAIPCREGSGSAVTGRMVLWPPIEPVLGIRPRQVHAAGVPNRASCRAEITLVPKGQHVGALGRGRMGSVAPQPWRACGAPPGWLVTVGGMRVRWGAQRQEAWLRPGWGCGNTRGPGRSSTGFVVAGFRCLRSKGWVGVLLVSQRNCIGLAAPFNTPPGCWREPVPLLDRPRAAGNGRYGRLCFGCPACRGGAEERGGTTWRGGGCGAVAVCRFGSKPQTSRPSERSLRHSRPRQGSGGGGGTAGLLPGEESAAAKVPLAWENSCGLHDHRNC